MPETVMVALIGFAGSAFVAICALAGQVIINRNDRKKRIAEDAEKEKKRAVEEALKEERLNARLNTIEKNLEENNMKLDIHNGYAEKIGDIQQDISYIKGKIEGEFNHG